MVSRAETLAGDIEAAVVAGDIPSGQRLGTKDDLRIQYAVAYGTLNEALRILQQRGYVTARTGPGGGLFASVPNPRLRLRYLFSGVPNGGTLAECVAVRNALEAAVAVDATASRTRTDIADLKRSIAKMAERLNDPGAFLYENWRLHRRIGQICRNRVLGNLYITLLDMDEPPPVGPASGRRPVDVRGSLTAHRQLVEAIAAGSALRARRAVEMHAAVFPPVEEVPPNRAAALAKKRSRDTASPRPPIPRQRPASRR